MAAKDGVFISYSRKDGMEFATAIRELLESRNIKVWQDVVQMEGGQDWWFQITDSLDNVEFMVLVATPGALASPIVRKEWRYARQQGVCVYPVLVPGNYPDYDQLPRWMRDIHFYDYSKPEQQVNFLQAVSGRCEFVKVPFMAGPLPDDYVERAERMEELLSLLLSDSRDEPVAITAALRGAGGYGKTVIAKALCHHDAVQAAYDDGILWVTLGENPGKPTEKLLNLIEVLTGGRPSFTDVDSARSRFREVVGERDLLIVIDDVWRSDDVEPFLNAGPRCTYLITTRDDSTLPRSSRKVRVDSMTPAESVQLLLVNIQNEPDIKISELDVEELKRLAKSLGNWALLLKLARGFMEEEILEFDRTLDQAVYTVRRSLENYGLQAFDPDDAEGLKLAVKSTLGASLSRLSPTEFARFTELGIFPEDVVVSLSAVERMWKATGKYNDLDTERLCRRLNRLSLLLDLELSNRRDGSQGYLRVHDVVRTYLRNEAEPDLPDMAARFLDSYQVDRWADLKESEDYLWEHLAYHLIEARRDDELVETVNNLEYLAAKIFLKGTSAAEIDLQMVTDKVEDRRDVRLLSQTIAKSSDVLAKCITRSEVLTNIAVRLNTDDVTPLEKVTIPTLVATYQLPDLPHYALDRTIKFNEHWVNDCDLLSEKGVVVATHNDNVVRMWNMYTGQLIAESEFSSGKDNLWRCKCLPKASLYVLSTVDGVLEMRSLKDSRVVWSYKVYEDPIFDIAVSGDEQYVVGCTKAKTISILDVTSGATIASLDIPSQIDDGIAVALRFNADHPLLYGVLSDGQVFIWSTVNWSLVHSFQIDMKSDEQIHYIDVSPNGNHLIIGGSKGLVQLWDIQNAKLIWDAGIDAHQGPLRKCKFNSDGKLASTVSNDRLIKIWDVATGKIAQIFQGHRDNVNSAMFSLNSKFVVSASKDGTIRVWNLNAEISTRRTIDSSHDSYVTSCEFSADGKLLATASHDQTVRIWDVEKGTMVARIEEHRSLIPDCTISPIGFTVVSVASNPRVTDNTLRSFDALTGQHLDSLKPTQLTVTLPRLPELPLEAKGDPRVGDLMQRLNQMLEKIAKRGASHKSTSAWLQSCQYSPDGSLIAVGTADLMGDDNTIKLIEWPAKTLKHELCGHESPLYDCAFSPDGLMIASVSSDRTIRIWDVESGEIKHVLQGHGASVFSCKFSHDGKLLLSASSDWTLRLWNVQTGEQLMVYEGHENPVWDCAFNHDSSLFISVSEDNTLKVWNVITGVVITTLYTEGFLLGCDWHSVSGQIAAVGERGVYYLSLIVPSSTN